MLLKENSILETCSLYHFVCLLDCDFLLNNNEWQNTDTDSYFEAIIAWLQSIPPGVSDDMLEISKNLDNDDWEFILKFLLSVIFSTCAYNLNQHQHRYKFNLSKGNLHSFCEWSQVFEQNYSQHKLQEIDFEYSLHEFFKKLLKAIKSSQCLRHNPFTWAFIAQILTAGKYYE